MKGNEVFLSGIREVPIVVLDDNFTLRLEIEEPSPEILEKARKELRETPELASESIKELQHLLKEDKELITPNDNTPWLMRFLRPTKFYPESAYALIKNYYSFKTKENAMYDGLVPSREKNIFQHDILTVMSVRDQEGRRILVLELGKKWKHKHCSLDELFKGVVLFVEAAMLEPHTQICGALVIFDMDGLSLQQTWQFTPTFAKRIVDFLQDSIPLRVKGIHIINQPYIFNMVFKLFKPFLREKLRSRIIFHGTDRESLHKHMSPECLPECYGGTCTVTRITGLQWYGILMDVEKEYEAINSYGYKKVEKK